MTYFRALPLLTKILATPLRRAVGRPDQMARRVGPPVTPVTRQLTAKTMEMSVTDDEWHCTELEHIVDSTGQERLHHFRSVSLIENMRPREKLQRSPVYTRIMTHVISSRALCSGE